MKILIKAAIFTLFNFNNCILIASSHRIEQSGPFYLCEECCVIVHSKCCIVSPLTCPACRDPRMQYSETLFFAKNDKEECPVCLDRYIPSPEMPITPLNSPSLMVSVANLEPKAPPVLLKSKEYYRIHQQLLDDAKLAKQVERRHLLDFTKKLARQQFTHLRKDKK